MKGNKLTYSIFSISENFLKTLTLWSLVRPNRQPGYWTRAHEHWVGSTDTTNIKKACFFQEPVCLWLWFLTACIFFLEKLSSVCKIQFSLAISLGIPERTVAFECSEKQQKLWTMALGSSNHAGGLHQWRQLRDLLKGRKKVGLKMQRCAACCLLGILKGLPAAGESCELDPTLPLPPREGWQHLVSRWTVSLASAVHFLPS